LDKKIDEYYRCLEKKKVLLGELGYHSLESLYNSLKRLENLILTINLKSIILNKNIGFFKSFDKTVSSTFNNILDS
jgi:hypothetical protein